MQTRLPVLWDLHRIEIVGCRRQPVPFDLQNIERALEQVFEGCEEMKYEVCVNGEVVVSNVDMDGVIDFLKTVGKIEEGKEIMVRSVEDESDCR